MVLKVLRKMLAVALMISLGTIYDDKLLLMYVTSNRYLQVILGITIAVIAWQLGKSRTRTDYSPYVYRFLVNVLGDPAKLKSKSR